MYMWRGLWRVLKIELLKFGRAPALCQRFSILNFSSRTQLNFLTYLVFIVVVGLAFWQQEMKIFESLSKASYQQMVKNLNLVSQPCWSGICEVWMRRITVIRNKHVEYLSWYIQVQLYTYYTNMIQNNIQIQYFLIFRACGCWINCHLEL